MVRNKLGYLLFLIIAGFFAILYNEYFIGIIFLTAVVFPMVLLSIAVYCSFKVRIKLDSTTKTAGKREFLNLTVNLNNTSIFPIARMNIVIEYYNELSKEGNKESIQVTLDQKSSQNVSCQISSKYSGNVLFKVKSITLYDYFHIWSFTRKSKQEIPVTVLPETYEIPVDIIKENHFINIDSGIYSDNRPGDDPSEVFGIREYREGDKPNRIHQKLTLKQSQLMVKEFSEPVKEVIAVFLDLNCKGKYVTRLQILDGLLDCIISIAYNLIINQHRFKMFWFENNERKEGEFSVQTEEDCLAAIGQLLKLQFPVNNTSILTEQNRYGINKSYTHVIYITSEFREEDIFEWSRNHKDTFFTVLYINDLDKYPVNEKLKSVLYDFNIDLYEIDINNIESTIRAVGIA
ncbi:DUF58 domain-containing protein [Anaerocolumna sp. MB42-C2]|uniref:DUF58 domain-containing protein n=1 Tax=Anaerocolumna sp. MB42-C2 TaxID=3070997 RepID=UPI0027E1DCA0|nr:DUF58 domain-containing protein [Anaerocolumna sp. MB42-C2]WMJ90067.1 DUF58 domain-containing protein [Anaerocolumna sp. MB42-C2]